MNCSINRGMTLKFEVNILDVREATEEELAAGQFQPDGNEQ